MNEIDFRPKEPIDRTWISQLITERWGSEIVVVHDHVYKPADLPGFIAMEGDERVGLITYHIEKDEIEIVTLDSLQLSAGIGSSLLKEICRVAQAEGCHRIWVITTNDNLDALRFYQRRGFSLVAVHRDAVAKARVKKPQIPKIGLHDILIKDEIELEMQLD